jgi:ABC-type transporter Mla subunit MlaD
MANSAVAMRDRGQDLNDSLGNIAGFANKGAGLLETLNMRRAALGDLILNTGNVFEALTRDEGQLRAFIGDSSQWLQATASQRENLATSIQIFPTFLRESRATLARLEDFSVDTKPLIDDLGPVARDLRPTLADLRLTAPSLQSFFTSLPAAINASKQGLPELSRVLRGLVPVLDATGPFLAQLNPILQWLQYQQGSVANFVSMPGWALMGKGSTVDGQANGHVLPQLIVAGTQTLISTSRTADNRGNTYFDQGALNNLSYPEFQTPPSFDCNNTTVHAPTSGTDPGCWIQGNHNFLGKSEKFPHILASDFSSPDVNGSRP